MLLTGLVVLAYFAAVEAYNNGIGGTPPMGWSTWCTNDLCGLRDKCSEFEVKKRADAMVDQGMAELGYQWILLDDCWAAHTRDANGNLQPDPKRFPNGIKSLSDYLHSRGLKFGLYTCVGTETCKKNRPGSYGYYQQDANTFAAWELDMVKADNCHRPDNITTVEAYTQLSQALNNTGRSMVFAMCEWGNDEVWNWAPDIAQMYRISMDHLPFFHWPATASGAGYGCGTAEIIDWMADLHPSKYVKAYAWMDPDFLETLFPISMNFVHSRTEFTFWTMWSAPLLVATDVCELSDEKRSILMNKEVLAVHQDTLFTAAERLKRAVDGTQVWTRPLANGDQAVVLYNANNDTALTVGFTWEEVGLPADKPVVLRDLWNQKDLGTFTQSFSALVGVNDVLMLRAQAV